MPQQDQTVTVRKDQLQRIVVMANAQASSGCSRDDYNALHDVMIAIRQSGTSGSQLAAVSFESEPD